MLYIFDKFDKLHVILGNSKGGCPFYEAPHTEVLNSENTFEFQVPANHPDAIFIKEENQVAFKDPDGDFQLFQIVEIQDSSHNGELTKRAFCEHAYYELVDDYINDKRPTSVSQQFALTTALEGTRWQVGTVSNLGLNSTNFYYESVLSSINKIINIWGSELRPRVTIAGNKITGRYIDLLSRRGAITGKRFSYVKDIDSVVRTIDLRPVKTALIGRGKGEETDGGGYGRRITFTDVVWSKANGDPVDKPKGQEWVGDPAILDKFGRLNSNGSKRHRFGFFEDGEEDDPVELLKKTWEECQKVKEPLTSYEMGVMDLEQISGYSHEKVRLGDTAGAINKDFVPKLLVNARVVKLVRYIGEPERTQVVLGNFIPAFTDDDRLEKLEAKLSDRSGVWDDKYKPGNPIDTSWLDGVIDVLNNEIESRGGWLKITDTDGLRMYNKPLDQTPTEVMEIKGGAFRIADSKKANGEWDWRTFGTGKGFTADLLIAGTIKTNLIQIQGDTYFYWDGSNQFIIDPANSNKQIRIGKYNGKNYGIGFTDDGGQNWKHELTFDKILFGSDATFKGTLDTLKAATIGNDLWVGTTSRNKTTLTVESGQSSSPKGSLKIESDSQWNLYGTTGAARIRAEQGVLYLEGGWANSSRRPDMVIGGTSHVIALDSGMWRWPADATGRLPTSEYGTYNHLDQMGEVYATDYNLFYIAPPTTIAGGLKVKYNHPGVSGSNHIQGNALVVEGATKITGLAGVPALEISKALDVGIPVLKVHMATGSSTRSLMQVTNTGGTPFEILGDGQAIFTGALRAKGNAYFGGLIDQEAANVGLNYIRRTTDANSPALYIEQHGASNQIATFREGTSASFIVLKGGVVGFGTSTSASGVSVDPAGGDARWRRDVNNYMRQTATALDLVFGGTIRHSFKSDGSKAGGTIDTESFGVLGMAPIDSPKLLIADLIVTEIQGVAEITIDPRYVETIEPGTLTVFAKAIGQGATVEVLEINDSSFKLSGEGKVNCFIIGIRRGCKDNYFWTQDELKTESGV